MKCSWSMLPRLIYSVHPITYSLYSIAFSSPFLKYLCSYILFLRINTVPCNLKSNKEQQTEEMTKKYKLGLWLRMYLRLVNFIVILVLMFFSFILSVDVFFFICVLYNFYANSLWGNTNVGSPYKVGLDFEKKKIIKISAEHSLYCHYAMI